MALRDRRGYRCTACPATFPKWVGRCSECHSWGSVVEVPAAPPGLRVAPVPAVGAPPAQRVRDIAADHARHRPTGVGELDRVLGGGFVPGGVMLLAGEPGVGKSTLLLDVAHRVAAAGTAVLLASGEESATQVALRAGRIGADAPDLFVAATTDLSVLLAQVDQVDPGLLIVDSIQTVAAGDVDGRAGGVAQVTEVTATLTRVAKQRGIPLILVGQVTKQNEIAGPRIIEHLVDVVLHFEGDRHSTLRLLRGVKNRYGPADEVGCFQMSGDGIHQVPDPAGLFLAARDEPVPGTCVTVVVEGKRPLPAEVQALVASSGLPVPRRGCAGLDSARLAMTQAVVERHGRLRLHDKDVYCATVGGMRISEPAADLAVALALASAAADTPLRGDVMALGEVALSGDIRPVPGVARRVAEAARLGFAVALTPPGGIGDAQPPAGLAVVEVAHISRALRAVADLRPC